MRAFASLAPSRLSIGRHRSPSRDLFAYPPSKCCHVVQLLNVALTTPFKPGSPECRCSLGIVSSGHSMSNPSKEEPCPLV